ncbi:DUF5304 domain-containing protein [Streptomyces sp. NPDC090052]|uniref:DUF5304 domain-containing protein n=1 Tax=unclassified Streptomyces TaxID=2593676 RepID=UPI0022597BD9|nr:MULTISPECIES: DUF5304 domain-containing protein [unclassified Streptomyces]MCX4727090.1 DUF5304 domain-containing protein [Streptomyces sp. NBC_01306]WSV03649.1 DUF5304 domain-containing protein [Streptomyces sp. NBC_01020]WSX41696.1 DUF5304 domain-containing protein [Streptomyces sp. NBC_00963]
MSEATEQPDTDSDAWAKACAEDLAAEKARRRAQYGSPEGSAADELKKLFEAVADKVSDFQSSLPGMAAQGAVQQFLSQAKSVVEPVVERNPDVFDHLAAAGGELLAAYRSAVEKQEQRWTAGRETAEGRDAGKDDGGDEGPGPAERIDLD